MPKTLAEPAASYTRFEELDSHPFANGKPWLIVGKGPSVDQIWRIDTTCYNVICINDAILKTKKAAVVIFTEADILKRPGLSGSMAMRAEWVMAGDPIRDPENGKRTLFIDLWRRCRMLRNLASIGGNLITYDWRQGESTDRGVVTARYSSSENALHLACILGATGTVYTIGIDGGTDYGNGFAPNANPAKRQNFNRQFPPLRRISHLYGVNVRPVIDPSCSK